MQEVGAKKFPFSILLLCVKHLPPVISLYAFLVTTSIHGGRGRPRPRCRGSGTDPVGLRLNDVVGLCVINAPLTGQRGRTLFYAGEDAHVPRYPRPLLFASPVTCVYARGTANGRPPALFGLPKGLCHFGSFKPSDNQRVVIVGLLGGKRPTITG